MDHSDEETMPLFPAKTLQRGLKNDRWSIKSISDRSHKRKSYDSDQSSLIEDSFSFCESCSNMLRCLEDMARRDNATRYWFRSLLRQEQGSRGFASIYAEIGFCISICLTQLLAEYLITGFAVELPHVVARLNDGSAQTGPGLFWPASLLTLVLSAFLLVFARVADKFGGYLLFMTGVSWLAIWTLIAGLAPGNIWLCLSRANQGLAIAMFTPAIFAMVAQAYEDGPRKNIVLGMFAGSAPVGFFAGYLVASGLPQSQTAWYFWIATAAAAFAALLTFLTFPNQPRSPSAEDLQMDWVGSFLLTSGLLLVSYALAAAPNTTDAEGIKGSFASAGVLGPLVSGLACLAVFVWFEGWVAQSPLLPLKFFQPGQMKILALACLFFHGSGGVWLYDSALFLQSSYATSPPGGVQGVELALWYAPTAIGGLLLCVCGSALLATISAKVLLCISGVAWVLAPLLLAVCPLPVPYWSYVMPSMLCATAGIDLTYTISIICMTRAQPARYQGLAGAICSILVNLGMSFSLPLSEIFSCQFAHATKIPHAGLTASASAAMDHTSLRVAFFYAVASAAVGLLLSLLFAMLPSVTATAEDEYCSLGEKQTSV